MKQSHFHCVDHVILSSVVLGTLFSCCECSSEDLTFFVCLLESLWCCLNQKTGLK